MPSIYQFEQEATSAQSYIIAIAADGSQYRIQWDKQRGGLTINKEAAADSESRVITVFPEYSNQIRIK